MKLRRITIHNFRSILDADFALEDYSILVGENNAGKSNVMAAIRAFYEVDGFKYKDSTDFPKFPTKDNESFVELSFQTSSSEQDNLKDEYKSSNKLLKVRRYFKSDDKELVDPKQSNIFGYEAGTLSKNLFYGAKNIGSAKLGEVIYIPAVSKPDDNMKLSGPSPLRDMVNFVMKRAVADSGSFKLLSSAFDVFNKGFRDESSKDGFSINELVDDINQEIAAWRVSFNININPIKPEEIVKGLLSHWVEDRRLGDARMEVGAFGHGLQRHLIYTLIRLASKYQIRTAAKKKEFRPDYLLILFEEPEAFLHPSQQDNLRLSLFALGKEDASQVLVTSHSTHFVSRQSEELSGLVRVARPANETFAYQVSDSDLSSLYSQNSGLYSIFSNLLNDPQASPSLKAKIRKKHLGDDVPDLVKKSEQESFKYFLYLDSERSALFFADRVLICEGASEKKFIDLVIDEHLPELRARQVYVLDAMGKFNIHRFMHLLGALGVSHSVLFDEDQDRDYHEQINQHINSIKNPFTRKIHTFSTDLEDYLSIDKPSRNDLKPLNLIMKYQAGEIEQAKIDDLVKLIKELMVQ